jgi:hypothetical protein
MIAALVGVYYISTPETIPQQKPPVVTDTRTKPEYAGLRIVIAAQEKSGITAVELDMNARQNNGGVEYYHYGALVENGSSYNAYAAGTQENTDIQPGGFITSIHTDHATDLSARAAISFAATIEGRHVEGTIDGLEGDFAEKDSPLYLKVISAGTAHIQIDGRPVEGHALVTSAYSRDYTQYVYFKEYNDVHGYARQFMLFDEMGDAYVIDRSDIENPVPAYTSHQWLMYKDASGFLRKGFSVTIQPTPGKGSTESAWHVETPDILATLELTSETRYTQGLPGRTVHGTITTATGETRTIFGIGHIEKL